MRKFFGPQDVVFYDNKLFVADTKNHKIRRIDLITQSVSTVCGIDEGFIDGKSTKAKFSNPVGIDVDHLGNLFVTESSESVHRVRCIVITPEKVTVSTLAGSETGGINEADSKGTKAKFNYPVGICFNNGTVFIADKANSCIRCIKLVKDKNRDSMVLESRNSMVLDGDSKRNTITSKGSKKELMFDGDFEKKVNDSIVVKELVEENNSITEQIEEVQRLINASPSREEFEEIKGMIKMMVKLNGLKKADNKK